MQKIIFIISGGHIGDMDFLKLRLSTLDPYELICADGGARYAYALGLTPQVIIGDMDSLDADMQRYFEDRGSLIIRHPKNKDETDTHLALEYACRQNPEAIKEIVVFGAFGGRIDHTLANLSLLIAGAEKGIVIKLVDEWCEVILVTDKAIIDGEAGQTVSIFPFPQSATGIFLEGFEYPLANGAMEIGNPYGISNRLLASRGLISVKSGYLLVVRYFKAGVFPQGE